jgi:anti-anti-sigma regulatory factor
MSNTSTTHAHIAYELIDELEPKVVVIEFQSRAVADSGHAGELGEQLRSLLRPDLPCRYVIDFKNIRTLGSSAFAEIARFARQVRNCGGQVKVCGLDEMVRLGAGLIGLDEEAESADDRLSAIQDLLELANRDRLAGTVHRVDSAHGR